LCSKSKNCSKEDWHSRKYKSDRKFSLFREASRGQVRQSVKDHKNYYVKSRDAKQVIRANTGQGGQTWRNIQNPDHTLDTSRTNAVTPMTHVLIQTIETKRKLTVNNPRLQELFLSPSPRSDVVIRIKRNGKAITFFKST